QYVNAQLTLTDTTNCSAQPVTCTTTTSVSLAVPLRLTSLFTFDPTGHGIYKLTLYADTTSLDVGSLPTYTWSACSGLTVDPWRTSATLSGAPCKVTVT